MQTFSSLSAVFLYKYHKSCGCGESIRGLQNLGASFSKGVNLFCAKGLFGCADSRFAEPRRVSKGFNFVSAWSLFGVADSRFGKPRNFPERETVLFFSLVRKEPKVPEGLRPSRLPGTIQISARFIIFAEVTGVHQVTGRAGHCKLSGYRR